MKKRTIFIVLGCIWLSALSVLLVLGYWLGPRTLRDIALGIFEISRPADLQQTHTLSNRYFSLKYPGNWLNNDHATIVIIEMRYDEDERNNRRGYDLIAESFKWKNL
jgi:hypothetical protein